MSGAIGVLPSTEVPAGAMDTAEPLDNSQGSIGVTVDGGAEPTTRRRGRNRIREIFADTALSPGDGPAPKKRGRKARGVLTKETVVAWMTTLHNVPSTLLSIDAMQLEAETIEPYAQQLADFFNERMPDFAGQAQENVTLLGVVGYFGLVEGPLWVNVYRELMAKQRQRQAEREAENAGTVAPPPTTPATAPARPVPGPVMVVGGSPAQNDLIATGLAIQGGQMAAINRLPK